MKQVFTDTQFASLMSGKYEELSKEAHRNVYMPVVLNRPTLHGLSKGSERDIELVFALVVDFDKGDGEWRSKLPKGLEPTIVLETSPGNFQVFLYFEEPQLPKEVKSLAVRLAEGTRDCDVGATKDLSHVWRIPGSLNWPNLKKVHEKGRAEEPFEVRVVHENLDAFVTIDLLDSILPKVKESPSSQPKTNLKKSLKKKNLKNLPSPRVTRLIEEGPGDEDEPIDRSELFHLCIAEMKDCLWTENEIFDYLSQYPLGIAEKYSDRLLQEIQRCYAKVKTPEERAHDIIDEINQDHFVAPEGSRVWVFVEGTDPQREIKTLSKLLPQSFKDKYANQSVTDFGGDKPRRIPAGDYWLKSSNRREFPKGIIFWPGKGSVPGYYNRWQGFRVCPADVKWDFTKEYIYEVLAKRDDLSFDNTHNQETSATRQITS